MTTVKRFGNLRLAIFPDHNPPHFHILGPECAVAVDLRTFEALEGRQGGGSAEAMEWAKANADVLWALWHELND